MEQLHAERGTEQVRLLIFDLDGTLADTVESIREGVNLAMDRYGFPRRSYEEVRRAIGNGAKDLIRRTLPSEVSADEALVARVFADYHAFYGETYRHCDRCYDGITDALVTLKQRGYQLAVLSNKQDEYVRALTEALIPQGVLSLSMGQTALPKKPDPTVPLMIAECLGVSPAQTAFIGDSDVDMQTGNNAGMLAVGCTWGYRERRFLVENGADWIVDAPCELTDLFGSAVKQEP